MSNKQYSEVKSCTHIDQSKKDVMAKTKGCEECEKIGSKWVKLRLCLGCGHVGCCDSSMGKHATKHYKDTGHPTMESFEPDENWKYCYIDEVTVRE